MGKGFIKITLILVIIFMTVTLNSFTFGVEKTDNKQIIVDISDMKWDYETAFTYDGTTHRVSLINIPEGISVEYSGNTAESPGGYVAKYTLIYDSETVRLSGIMPSPLVWYINGVENEEKSAPSTPKINIESIYPPSAPLPHEGRADSLPLIISLSLLSIALILAAVRYNLIKRIRKGIRPDSDIIPPAVRLIPRTGARSASMRRLVLMRYKTTYYARLHMADGRARGLYCDLKREILSYTGARSYIGKSRERVAYKRKTVAKINIRGSRIHLSLALNPEEYDRIKYKHLSLAGKSKEDCPLLIKITGKRSLSRATELLSYAMKNAGAIKYSRYSDSIECEAITRDALIQEGHIRVLYSHKNKSEEDDIVRDNIARFFV